MVRAKTAGVLFVLLAAWLVSAGPASARAPEPESGSESVTQRVGKRHYVSRDYERNWVFRSTKLNKCAFISVKSRMSGYWEYAYRVPNGQYDPNYYKWTGMKLHDPEVRVVPWKIRGAGCDSTKRWPIKAEISQGWHEHSCGLSVAVAVGVPWSVDASPSFSCKDKKLGWEKSIEGSEYPARALTQYNSGTILKFGDAIAPAGMDLAFQQELFLRIFTKTGSDNWKGKFNVYLGR